MIGRRAPRVLTPEENRARNIERILNPPTPTLWERARILPLKAESWWWKHVTHRDLHRRLNNCRLDMDALRAAHQHTGDCRYPE